MGLGQAPLHRHGTHCIDTVKGHFGRVLLGPYRPTTLPLDVHWQKVLSVGMTDLADYLYNPQKLLENIHYMEKISSPVKI